jgi:hypothetical protein
MCANHTGWLRAPKSGPETGPRLTLGRREAPSRGKVRRGPALPGQIIQDQDSNLSAVFIIANPHDLRTRPFIREGPQKGGHSTSAGPAWSLDLWFWCGPVSGLPLQAMTTAFTSASNSGAPSVLPWAVSTTRSGCGIMPRTRRFSDSTPAISATDPLGLLP